MNDTGIIILAAGSSSRLGRTKQLLLFRRKTLLQHSVDEALAARLQPVVVVTGANADVVLQAIGQQPIQMVYNPDWQQGMASGIACGLSKILSLNNSIESVIIAVCDQPFVSSTLFLELCEAKEQSNKGIVASAYADTTGTPVIFTRKYFDQLLHLQGEGGAKKLVTLYNDDVATVSFPDGNVDIDTEDDYHKLINHQ